MLKELTSDVLVGVVAVDGEPTDVAGVLRRVAPQFAIRLEAQREGVYRTVLDMSDVDLATRDGLGNGPRREGAHPLVGDAARDQPVIGAV